MIRKTTTIGNACRKCSGRGCAHCGFTGDDRIRRQLTDAGEHPAVSAVRATGQAWARTDGTRQARSFVEALVVFAEIVNYALGRPARKGKRR